MSDFLRGSAVLALLLCGIGSIAVAVHTFWGWTIDGFERRRDRIVGTAMTLILVAVVWTFFALNIGDSR